MGAPRAAAAADSGSAQPCLVGSPTGRAKDFLGGWTSMVRRMLPRGPASEAVICKPQSDCKPGGIFPSRMITIVAIAAGSY